MEQYWQNCLATILKILNISNIFRITREAFQIISITNLTKAKCQRPLSAIKTKKI